MASLRQAFSWWCFVNRGLDADTLLSTARRIGYEAVDLIPRELWPLARQHGLAISAVDGHRSIIEGLNRREHHARIERELRDNIAAASAAGVHSLICFSGSRGELADEPAIAACAELLRKVTPVAEAAGVTLNLELLNSRVDHPDYQCDRTAWGLRVVQQVDSPAVRLLYDIYHMQIMEGDILRTIRETYPWIGYYHTAGNPGRGPLNDDQELNYPPIFRAIERTGYRGFISHEFTPQRDVAAELADAFRLCAES